MVLSRLSLLALAVLVLPLAFAAPALAGPPTTEVIVNEDESFVDEDLCGFPITFTQNGTFKVKTYYDRAGNEVKSILTNLGPYTETASANGKTLRTTFPAVFITSLPSGGFAQLGLRATYHAPGTGVVLLDAGRIVFDPDGEVVFEAGPHQFIDGPLDAFCAYFAA